FFFIHSIGFFRHSISFYICCIFIFRIHFSRVFRFCFGLLRLIFFRFSHSQFLFCFRYVLSRFCCIGFILRRLLSWLLFLLLNRLCFVLLRRFRLRFLSRRRCRYWLFHRRSRDGRRIE